eukprot:jgi/Galph1/1259/GphlegSOOS_G6089.1
MSSNNSTEGLSVVDQTPSPVVAVAIINSKNHPLVIRVYDCPESIVHLPKAGETREQQIQYLLFRSLDCLPGQGSASVKRIPSDGYLGCITPQEVLPIHAYVTNTGITILLALIPGSYVDARLKQLFRKIHQIYIENMMNPFYIYNSPIASKKICNKLITLQRAWNNALFFKFLSLLQNIDRLVEAW